MGSGRVRSGSGEWEGEEWRVRSGERRIGQSIVVDLLHFPKLASIQF